MSSIRSTGKTRALMLLSLLVWVGLGSACASSQGPDPWEGANRKTFAFNEGLDKYAIEPVAKGWDFVVPDPVERALGKVFDNLRVPLSFVNNVLMLRPRAAGEDVGRFVLNTVAGVGGLFDPASNLEIPDHQSNFGLTMARWGTPPGPYFVIPVLGPSTVRDTGGLVGDFAIYTGLFLPLAVTIPMRVVEAVNLRSLYLEEVDENRRTSFDYYVFMRNAYLQNRERKVARARGVAEADQEVDLYELDDEE